jgi:hypothetical protein
MREWLSDLAESQLRDILGTRAIDVYDLDLTPLQRIADEIGPRLEDLSVPSDDRSAAQV